MADSAVRPVGSAHQSQVGKSLWIDRHWHLVVGLLLVVNLVVLLWNIGGYPAPFDDEGTYVSQAWSVLERGQLSHYTYWYDHPPIGWLLLVPWMWITGAFTTATPLVHARVFMAIVGVGSALLVYILARRLGLRRMFALLSLVLFAFSPLAVHFQRMVLLDNLALFLLLGAFALLASPRRRLWEQQTGVAVFAISVLTKETMLLLAPVILLFLWQGTDESNRRYSLGLAASIFASILLLYPTFAALRGELLPGEGHVSLWDAIQYQLFGREGSGSVLDSSSPRRELIGNWMRLDTFLPAMGLMAAPMVLAIRQLRPIGLGILMVALGALRPGYLPAMFIVAGLPLFALQTAGVVDILWGRASGRHETFRLTAFKKLGQGVVLVSVVAAISLVAPAWALSLHRQMTQDDTREYRQAREWLLANVDPSTPILVDNNLWIDLVVAGYSTKSTVWFYKLDLDPSVADQFPGGAGDFEYVVSTPLMRTVQDSLPTVSKALRMSVIEQSIGGFQIRKIS